MQTGTTVQRSTAQPETKLEVHISEAAGDFLAVAQALTPEQARILNQIISPLDRAVLPVRIGFFSPRYADRSTLIDFLVRPVASRKVRTPEHRKVVGLRVDATARPEGLQPWHYLILSVIEMLSESAMPSERTLLSELRNEINRLIHTYRRDPDAAHQPAITFARRFLALFPKLVLNAISLSNSVLLVVMDHVDEVEPSDAAQWLESSRYFLSAQGCTVLVSASEPSLIAKLTLSAENANGKEILKSWVTRRVEFALPPVIDVPINPPAAPASRAPVVHESDRGSIKPSGVPPACANILRDALQPDVAAVVDATSRWRAAMRAIQRRVEEGLGSTISGTLVAKIIAIQCVAPALYDTARYDAQLLLGLERAAHGDTSSDVYVEWTSQVAKHPRMVGIIAAEPSFASVDLRDLATALRLSYTEEDEEALASLTDTALLDEPSQQPARRRTESKVSVAQTLLELGLDAAGRIAISPMIVMTASASAVIFILDRVTKLVVQSTFSQPDSALLYGLIKPEFLQTATTSIWGGSLAVGTELFGLALAVLIAVFWGSGRKPLFYAASLGLIIGALASNLFDRLAFGSVLDFVHIANLPVFNLSHLALLAGSLLLAYSILRGSVASADQAGVR